MMVNGKRERKWCGEWTTKEDVIKAVHERQEQIQAGQVERPADATFSQVVNHYLKFKAGKRSLANDRHILEKQLVPAFGAGLPIRQLTTQMIAAYEERRKAELSCRKTKVSDWTLRNELTVLRHLLRLPHRRWGYLDRVPVIEMPKAPKGRTRFLNEEEMCDIEEPASVGHCDCRGEHWYVQVRDPEFALGAHKPGQGLRVQRSA